MTRLDKKFGIMLLVTQVVLIILFGVFSLYETETAGNDLDRYAYFQDIHIMIFIGFGFLMTFLKRYGFGAIGFNLVLAAMVVQWSMIVQKFLDFGGTWNVTFVSLLDADIAAAAVLISFGAVLGRLHPYQLWTMAIIETVLFGINFYIALHWLHATDYGGSIVVHSFGAYFGLAVAAICHKEHHIKHKAASSDYKSDLFAMIGSVFLWICWPSFNGALVPDPNGRYRAIVNTYLSLVACTVVACGMSSLVHPKNKIRMDHIQNATLAGGVAAGACGNFILYPWGALLLGSIAGAISVLGYTYLTPFLTNKFDCFDTCGVHNLHGMPGLLSAVASIIGILVATESQYGRKDFVATFPQRSPVVIGNETQKNEDAWSAGHQAGIQALALAITLVIAIVGGVLTGFLLKLPIFSPLSEEEVYEDAPFWEMPSDDEEEVDTVKVVKRVVENENGAMEITQRTTTTTLTN